MNDDGNTASALQAMFSPEQQKETREIAEKMMAAIPDDANSANVLFAVLGILSGIKKFAESKSDDMSMTKPDIIEGMDRLIKAATRIGTPTTMTDGESKVEFTPDANNEGQYIKVEATGDDVKAAKALSAELCTLFAAKGIAPTVATIALMMLLESMAETNRKMQGFSGHGFMMPGQVGHA